MFQTTVDFIKSKTLLKPEICIISRVDISSIKNEIKEKTIISLKDIPDFPNRIDDSGELIIGTFEGKKVIFSPALLYCKGYTMQEVAYPVRVAKLLGCDKLILVDVVFPVSQSLKKDDIVVITDHINYVGDNPLIGKNYSEFGVRFPDISSAYNSEFISTVMSESERLNVKVNKGVYVGIQNPLLPTSAELRFYSIIEANVAGISTIPEVITAVHSKMSVLAFSSVGYNLFDSSEDRISEGLNIAGTLFKNDNLVRLLKSVIIKI